MKTMSLKFWKFFAIVTIGLSGSGCAAEASTPEETVTEDVAQAPREGQTGNVTDATDPVDADRSTPMLVRGVGPHPADGVMGGGSSFLPPEKAPPNPCPGQVNPVAPAR